MRHLMLCLLLLACTGCLRPFDLAEQIRREQRANVPPPPLLPTPVTAEQVTTQNAHKLSQALLDEMDRETQK